MYNGLKPSSCTALHVGPNFIELRLKNAENTALNNCLLSRNEQDTSHKVTCGMVVWFPGNLILVNIIFVRLKQYETGPGLEINNN